MSWVQILAARRARSSGQSIPIIALMIVVLIGMVGLSVDVGNTYAEQRKVVSAANAAAIAGMKAYIGNSTISDSDVYNAIVASLRSNGVDAGDQPGQIKFEAYYYGEDGNRIGTCNPVGACGGSLGNVNV
ncbi:MAG: pilus assembly protein TadG-related protein, partial [Chloroflexales bacterium]|nr:pilus assembly protein TadG-related protein [Chloroflexales bacterium]